MEAIQYILTAAFFFLVAVEIWVFRVKWVTTSVLLPGAFALACGTAKIVFALAYGSTLALALWMVATIIQAVVVCVEGIGLLK